MSRPPYFRPYGAQAFTRAVSASARTSVPRFWRMYLALWLISRWRLPATPCLILPVAVSLKRFFTPLLVFSLGILSPLRRLCGRDIVQSPRQPFRPGHWDFHEAGKGAPIEGERRQGKKDSSPAKAGVQFFILLSRNHWAPAFAGAQLPGVAGAVALEEAAGVLGAEPLDQAA